MYPELVKYKQIKKQYEEQLERLKLEQGDLEEEKEELLTKYEKVLSKIGRQKTSIHDNPSDFRSEVQTLTDELGDVMEQISHLSNAKKERLNEWIDPLQKGLDREVIAAKQHLKIKKDEFKRYRMELFLLIQQLFEIEEYVHDIHRSYTEACEEHMTSQEKQTLKLQSIHIRKEAKHMLEELHQDLDEVVRTGEMPEWFTEKMQK
ncbi:hypothetical protein [Alkalihalobacillus sp. AL-G]|uniref:hypothetical protein n=1 Tax=Alkalihalobacillus sp. AL-G TaxID=2926399 RepID=UPI00272D2D63|nr:hypothetical protein [Alkalihalobacillus sp. AL-G]WLD94163.1 hypothetical protein MOJ78_04510 [Alkalihalobacillus sp. AL-G]